MITICFVIGNTSEEKAKQLLQQIADHTINHINQIMPNMIITGTPWVYQRESDKTSEPALIFITDTLQQYLWASAKTIDREAHQIWIFDIQCNNHTIAIPDINNPTFHILNPDQVSTLFRTLAQTISTLVDVEVSYNDDHTRHGIIYHHGTPTEDEHW